MAARSRESAGRGIGPGDFQGPELAGFSGDTLLWITDRTLDRVSYFDSVGRFVRSQPWPRGVSRSTIQRGLRELEAGETLDVSRERRPGGGRKPASEKDPNLLTDLDALVEPLASGDPQSPLRWTAKSVTYYERRAERDGA